MLITSCADGLSFLPDLCWRHKQPTPPPSTPCLKGPLLPIARSWSHSRLVTVSQHVVSQHSDTRARGPRARLTASTPSIRDVIVPHCFGRVGEVAEGPVVLYMQTAAPPGGRNVKRSNLWDIASTRHEHFWTLHHRTWLNYSVTLNKLMLFFCSSNRSGLTSQTLCCFVSLVGVCVFVCEVAVWSAWPFSVSAQDRPINLSLWDAIIFEACRQYAHW